MEPLKFGKQHKTVIPTSRDACLIGSRRRQIRSVFEYKHLVACLGQQEHSATNLNYNAN